MRRSLSFLLACALAAAAPLFSRGEATAPGLGEFPGWPETIDGRELLERPIEERELPFTERFPGRVARFSDGRAEWILRWIPRPTRRLHSAAQCYRGIGFSIEHLPLECDSAGILWSRFQGVRGEETYLVRERIHDDAGRSWTDTSSWYWSAVIGSAEGPWWAVTSVERQ